MIQQPPNYNFTVTRPHNLPSTSRPNNNSQLLPSFLVDFTAISLCDLMPTQRPTSGRSLPELVFFIQKVTHQANVHIRTILVALLYLKRAKSNLPKRAVGGDDTNHRMFLGALLIASKYLKGTEWSTQALTNRRIYEICGGLFSLEDVHQLERAFLKLIQYNCWVTDEQLNDFVLLHQSDFSL